MSVKIFFWNVRELNDERKHPDFKRWLQSHRVLFGALLETHIKEPNLNQVMNEVCPTWSFTSNHNDDPTGMIILIWKPHLTVVILHSSKQSMTCKVTYPGAADFLYTAVYVANTSEERNELWIELLNLQADLHVGTSPWLIGGDFNEIFHLLEHSPSGMNMFTTPMVDFKTCIDHLEMRNLRYHGTKFFWSNKQPDDPIARKLDRALINEYWLNSFPRSLANFLAPEISDHTPCCITLE